MVKLLKDYIQYFGKWLWLITAFIVGDVLGIIQSYFTEVKFPTWAWWLILVIILACSPFLAFYKLRLEKDKLQNYLNDIKNTRPLPQISIYLKNNQAMLEVYNDGARAVFRITSKILEGTRKGELYGLISNPGLEIFNKETKRILIAEIHDGNIRLCSADNKFPALSPKELDEYLLYLRYPNSYTEMTGNIPPEDKCVLEIIVTSDPTPISLIKTKRYILTKDKVRNLMINEIVPNPDN